jgi:zinc/manganese transport system substrate-binding protein
MSMSTRRTILKTLAAASAAPLTALHAQTAAPARKPQIVASFSILADMASEVAPAGIEVSALVGPDADAHVFEPTPAHGRRLAQADLVIVNGMGFEGWIDRLIKVSGYKGTVVVATRGITPRKVGKHGGSHAGHQHSHGGSDPHAWQDLALARRYVANLAAGIGERWPEHRAEVQTRSADYSARIDALDRQVRDGLAPIPRAQRRVISSHDAFGYFGDAYGIDFLSPQGWSTNSEPSAASVARLIRQVRDQSVRALFVENISDPRLLERIASEAKVSVGGTLFSDALSAPGGPADTYLKMMAHNARSLTAALSAPR